MINQGHLPPASRDGTRSSANSRVYGSKLLTSCSSHLNLPAVALRAGALTHQSTIKREYIRAGCED